MSLKNKAIDDLSRLSYQTASETKSGVEYVGLYMLETMIAMDARHRIVASPSIFVSGRSRRLRLVARVYAWSASAGKWAESPCASAVAADYYISGRHWFPVGALQAMASGVGLSEELSAWMHRQDKAMITTREESADIRPLETPRG